MTSDPSNEKRTDEPTDEPTILDDAITAVEAVRVANCDHHNLTDGDVDISQPDEMYEDYRCQDCNASVTVVYRPAMAKIEAPNGGYTEVAGVDSTGEIERGNGPEVIEP